MWKESSQEESETYLLPICELHFILFLSHTPPHTVKPPSNSALWLLSKLY